MSLFADYRDCRRKAVARFRGRPAALFLLGPGNRHLAAVYALAADIEDLAARGREPVEDRQATLDDWEAALEGRREADTPTLRALAHSLQRQQLLLDPLKNLIEGGRRATRGEQPEHFGELMEYVRLRGIPLTRQYLHQKGITDPETLARGDALGSALGLLDIYFGLGRETRARGTSWLPADEMERFRVSAEAVAKGETQIGLRQMMRHQLQRTLGVLNSGAVLTRQVGILWGLPLRLVVLRAWQLGQRFQQQPGFFQPPRLKAGDWPIVLWRAVKAGF